MGKDDKRKGLDVQNTTHLMASCVLCVGGVIVLWRVSRVTADRGVLARCIYKRPAAMKGGSLLVGLVAGWPASSPKGLAFVVADSQRPLRLCDRRHRHACLCAIAQDAPHPAVAAGSPLGGGG